MNRQELLQQLQIHLARFAPPDHPLNQDAELTGDLQLDSVKVMELLLVIEDHFEVSIPLNLLPNIRTVGDLAEQLAQLLELTE